MLTSVIGLLVSVGLVIAIIILLISPWISNLLNIEAEFAKAATIVFIITGTSFAALFPIRIGQGIIAGYQRYEITNILITIGPVLRLNAILVLVGMNT